MRSTVSVSLPSRQDDDGEITHLFLGWVPVVALERIGLTGNPMLHAVIAVSSLVLFMGAALLWPRRRSAA